MELQFIRTEFSKTDMACASNGRIQTIKRHKELSISVYSYNILSEKKNQNIKTPTISINGLKNSLHYEWLTFTFKSWFSKIILIFGLVFQNKTLASVLVIKNPITFFKDVIPASIL